MVISGVSISLSVSAPSIHRMAATISIAPETELETRARIVNNVFKERHNCILLRLDTHMNDDKGVNPFGFHFEFDRAKYDENKKRIRRQNITRWLAIAAAIHHNFGLRHILLITLITLYTLMGGFMFEALESENEYNNLRHTIEVMDEIMDDYVKEVIKVSAREMNETLLYDILMRKAKVFYVEMLTAEDRYQGSAWHKAENLDLHLVWNINSAIFYSFTVFTTLGYGSIACDTWAGRWISMVYACFGIPLMLLTIGDLGELIQRKLCIVIDLVIRKIRLIRNGSEKENEIDVEKVSSYSEESEEDDDRLPVWFSILLLSSYTLLISVVVFLLDKGEYGEPGLDFQSSFYFVFCSITTIGFGDVMPSSVEYNILFVFTFLFGLTFLSIVNSSVYARLYDVFYTGVTTMESSLDSIHARVHRRNGHTLFTNLHPAFISLVLSFPSSKQRRRPPNIIFTQSSIRKNSDSSNNSMGSINERSQSTCLPPMKSSEERRQAIKRVQSAYERPRVSTYGNLPPARSRVTQSPIERHMYRKRAPTIGPFGGVEIVRQKRKESHSRSLSPIRNK